MAFAGDLTFNPLTDSLPRPDGSSFRFTPPQGPSLPQRGYERTLELYGPPPEDGSSVDLAVDPSSNRIQLIEPFDAWNGEDEQEVELLIKVRGKCSMSRISVSPSMTPG
jgi:aconitate hydratase